MCSGEGDFLTHLPVVCFSSVWWNCWKSTCLCSLQTLQKINTTSLTLLIQILDSERGTRLFSCYPVLPHTSGWPGPPWWNCSCCSCWGYWNRPSTGQQRVGGHYRAGCELGFNLILQLWSVELQVGKMSLPGTKGQVSWWQHDSCGDVVVDGTRRSDWETASSSSWSHQE